MSVDYGQRLFHDDMISRLIRSSLGTVMAVAMIAGSVMPVVAQQADPPGALMIGLFEQMRERQGLQPIIDEADPDGDDPDAAIERLELDGMIVDETITRIGRDFYDAFFARWTSPPQAINFTLSITEQPVPGLGTLVIIRANGEVVYQIRLQPQIDFIEAAAAQGVGFAARYLERSAATPRIY